MIATTQEESHLAFAVYAASGVAGSAQLKAIGATLESPAFPGAVFAVHRSGQVLCAAAPDWRHWRRLMPLLMARIGSTLSSLPSPVQEAKASPHLEKLLGGFTPRLWCRIDLVDDPEQQHRALEACEQLVRDVTGHAALISPPSQPAGVIQLLDAYESALATRDLDGANQALDQLQQAGHLDAANARFLRLRLLDAYGEERHQDAVQLAHTLKLLPVPSEIRTIRDRLVSQG
jgi:hypothetical protein